MKDSRVGAYGAIGILLLLMLKFFTLNEMPANKMIMTLIAAHMISRMMAAWTMHSLAYVRDDEKSKSKPITKALQSKDLLIAIAISTLPLLFFADIKVFMILIPAFIAKLLLERYFKRWIGGYTGDCLGTIQQVTEIVLYLGLLALFTTQANNFTWPLIK
jgi:adenosylcobinamide-GDP ribazoletransferase